MKKLFTLVFLLITTTILAQFKVGNNTLNFSEAIPKDKGNIMAIAGIKNDTIYTISRTKKEFFFQTYDAKTKSLISTKPFEIIRGYEIRDYVMVGEKLFLMLSYYNETLNRYSFFAREVKDNEIANSINIFSKTVKNPSEKGEFLFKISNDSTKYLITHVIKNNGSTTAEYNLVLVDKNLNKVFTDTNSITSEQKRVWSFKFSDTKFTKSGDIVFTVIESYRDKSEKTKFNNVILYAYEANNNYNRKETKIEVQDNYLADCTVVPTKDNRLHIAGFYSPLKKSGKRQWYYGGLYDIVFDYNEGKVIKTNFISFPDFIYLAFGSKDAKKSKGLYYEWFKNVAFIERDDGGIIILTEKNWKGEPDTLGVWPLAWTTYSFDSGHVLVTALNRDGKLYWNNFIPKIQWLSIDVLGIQLIPIPNYTQPGTMNFPVSELGTGEEFISVFPVYENGTLTVYYNDHHKTTEENLRILEGLNRMTTVAYTFNDKTGEAKRVVPREFNKGQINLKPLIHYKISDKRYLIYGGNKKTNALGELIIKK